MSDIDWVAIVMKRCRDDFTLSLGAPVHHTLDFEFHCVSKIVFLLDDTVAVSTPDRKQESKSQRNQCRRLPVKANSFHYSTITRSLFQKAAVDVAGRVTGQTTRARFAACRRRYEGRGRLPAARALMGNFEACRDCLDLDDILLHDSYGSSSSSGKYRAGPSL